MVWTNRVGGWQWVCTTWHWSQLLEHFVKICQVWPVTSVKIAIGKLNTYIHTCLYVMYATMVLCFSGDVRSYTRVHGWECHSINATINCKHSFVFHSVLLEFFSKQSLLDGSPTYVHTCKYACTVVLCCPGSLCFEYWGTKMAWEIEKDNVIIYVHMYSFRQEIPTRLVCGCTVYNSVPV